MAPRRASAVGSSPLIIPRARYPAGEPRQILVLEYGPNPTTDYYIRPRLASLGVPHAEIVDISRTDPRSVSICSGTVLIIVRYLTDAWARYLRQMKRQFCRVVYFADDDLPSALYAPGLPLRYRYKIFKFFIRQRAILSELCSEVWVSTARLAEKYGLQASAVMGPVPLTEASTAPVRATYFYAGTASHRHELRWLRDVVSAVQQRSRDLTFITFGGSDVRRLFHGIPRVLCIHPVPWPTFLESLPSIRLDIGLAPLLSGTFNHGRSPTKFFDITRLGGVGLYSDAVPYADFIQAGVDGYLLKNDPEPWCSTVLDLADDPEKRRTVLQQARTRVASIASESRFVMQKLRGCDGTACPLSRAP